MSKRYTKKKDIRPKAPFIRSFGYIASGFVLIVILVYIVSTVSYNEVTDSIGAIGFIIVLGGLGLLGIIVGLKKRRW